MSLNEIIVFFSWQSDLAQEPTTLAIRKALRLAFNEIEARHPISLTLDQATREMVGADNIPSEIVRKIEAADIFVCDITTVTTFEGKASPNPNVAYELGFAVALLGWRRNILLFNEELAPFKELPFDFDRQRISKYKLPDNKAKIKSMEGSLRALLTTAVETIVLADPKRPHELKIKTGAELKRERDLTNIKWYLAQISTSLLDVHIREMPDRLHYFAGFMHDGLEGVVHRSDFKLYDTKLETLMRKLHRNLGETLKYDRYYKSINFDNIQTFGNRFPGFNFSDAEDELTTAGKISAAVKKLDKDVRKLVERIRHDYIEIDLDQSNTAFSKAYNKEMSGR